MAENHIIEAHYTNGGYFKTRAAFRYDYGQTLRLVGFPDLPSTFEIHFASSASDPAVVQIGSNGEVDIPDVYLTHAGNISAWLYLHDTANDGETVFTIEIPVNQRASITDIQPTPQEQTVIEQLIAQMTTAAADVQQAAEDAISDIEDETAEAIEEIQATVELIETTVDIVSGTTVVINGEASHRYMCGTVQSIEINPPASGVIDVIFTSGTTPAVLSLPNTVQMPEWFTTPLDASTTYEIMITDGVYGAVMTWAQ